MSLRMVAFWVLVAATLAVYLAMILWSLPFIAAEAGGLVPFDLRPTGYSVSEARVFLEALSDAGRDHYLVTQHMLDRFYPAMLGATLVFSFWLLIRRALIVGLAALPAILGMVFDYIENARVTTLLTGDAPTDMQIEAAHMATILKSGFSTVAFVLLLAAILFRLYGRWKGRA